MHSKDLILKWSDDTYYVILHSLSGKVMKCDNMDDSLYILEHLNSIEGIEE